MGFCFVFHSDCLIFTPNDFELHLSQLEKVLIKLKTANMHLKLSKCHFAAAELPFLGHIVGRFGLKIDPTKVEKLNKTKFPTTKREVRQFLGLAGYFRDFIKDYAEIAAPLTNLTKDTTKEPFELSTSEKEAVTTLIRKKVRTQSYNSQTSTYHSF